MYGCQGRTQETISGMVLKKIKVGIHKFHIIHTAGITLLLYTFYFRYLYYIHIHISILHIIDNLFFVPAMRSPLMDVNDEWYKCSVIQ